LGSFDLSSGVVIFGVMVFLSSQESAFNEVSSALVKSLWIAGELNLNNFEQPVIHRLQLTVSLLVGGCSEPWSIPCDLSQAAASA
jgi:hypothetical protein